MLNFTILGSNAFKYLFHELSNGRDIASFLLENDLLNGYLYSYIPSSFTSNELSHLNLGLRLQIENAFSNEMRQFAIKFISDYLENNQHGIVIFETFAEKGDPSIFIDHHQHFYISNKKYDYILSSDQQWPISEYLNYASNYPTVVSLMKLDIENSVIDISKDITISQLHDSISEIDYIIIGAFDEEGYIYWCKNNPKTKKSQ